MKLKFATFLAAVLPLLTPQPWLGAQSPEQMERMRTINPALPTPIAIDESLVAGLGIKTSSSKHLTLYTDINGRDDIQELVDVFDFAVAEWCSYFDIEPASTAAWHLRGMVIADAEKFRKAKLLPNDLPAFPAAFQRGHEMWIYLQPGEYYTRHLLIHEGTHSFMQWFLGGTGAPWYTEGMAELLGVHAWEAGRLKINFKLKDRSQAAYWGRIKLIHKDLQNGKMRSLQDVFNIQPTAFREVRFYAWSWAACEFLSSHPKSRQAFAKLKVNANMPAAQFNQSFGAMIEQDLAELERDWQLFIDEIDFGYDVSAALMKNAKQQPQQPNVFEIKANASWQSTNFQVAAGDRIEINGSGRFVIANREGIPWPCEADGITIEYYRGNPLGQLMVGVLGSDGQAAGLKTVKPIGRAKTVRIEEAGTICFRVNESPTQMYDNQGKIKITIRSQD